jgi:hypothetical protein
VDRPKTAKIATKEGLQDAALLYVSGEWGVTREADWESWYNATHLPTGFRLPMTEDLPVVLSAVKLLAAEIPPFDLRTLDSVRERLQALINGLLVLEGRRG